MLDAKRPMEIAEKTGIIPQQPSAINQSLLHYGTDGYKLAIDRVKAKKEKESITKLLESIY